VRAAAAGRGSERDYMLMEDGQKKRTKLRSYRSGHHRAGMGRADGLRLMP